MRKIFAICIFALSLLGCQQAEKGLMLINTINDYYKIESVKLTDAVKSLEYIHLQTDSTCLIGNDPEIYVTNDYVISLDSKHCFLFSRKDGKFIREVLHKGTDANGYLSTLRGGNIAFIEESNELMFQGITPNTIDIYSLKTDTKRIWHIHGLAPTMAPMGSDAFVSVNRNLFGNNPISMYLYNNDQAVDSLANTQMFESKENSLIVITNDDFFYRHAGKTYYKNMTNDTLYHVDLQGIHPHAVFLQGEKAMTVEVRQQAELFRNNQVLFQIFNIAEDKDAIYYQLKHQKKVSHLIYKKSDGTGYRVEGEGFENDIDGIADMWPHRIMQNKEYVFVIDPSTLKKDALTKLNAKADDNPVIVIGHK